MDFNPFDNVIVSEPRKIEKPVTGLNDKALDALLDRFDRLLQQDPPRAQKSNSAQFILSPTAGYGKSHLIGRLFKELKSKATLVYLRPFSDAASCWRSILLKMVQEMEFPESAESEFCSGAELNQLETLAHGVIKNIFVNAYANGAIQIEEKDAVLKALKSLSLEKMRTRKNWIKGVLHQKAKLASMLNRQFAQAGLKLNVSPISWISIFVVYAYFSEDFQLRESCLDWIKGGSVDSSDAGRIGIRSTDRLSGDADMGAVNEVCKSRILDLCSLAGYYRPFVLCFDQTENYGSDPAIARTLGLVVQELVDTGCNLFVVLTANQQPWVQSLEPHWEDAHRARLGQPHLELEGLSQQQAKELIQNRLTGWDLESKDISRFSAKKWLDSLFTSPQIGVRQFLTECSKRWQIQKDQPPPPAPKIDAYFDEFINRVKSRPRRLVFDPDVLYWLVSELALLPTGKIEKCKSPKGYFSLRWKYKERNVYFGFEPGSNWSRWGAIQREGKRYYAGDKRCKVVYFRTPELKRIPGRWKIAPEINSSRESFLHIIELDRSLMAQLYAAYDLYVAAVEGDIPFDRDAVLVFLREKLKGFWERILEPDPEKWGDNENSEESVPLLVEPQRTLVEKIRNIVKEEKFLSVKDLMEKLSDSVSEQELHEARGCIPEIQVHAGPNMTILQWRPR